MALSKTCPRCGLSKPLEEFPLSSTGTHGRYGYCKPCKAEYMRERKQAMKNDGRMFEENLIRTLRRYGVDLDWYRRQVEEQDGLCGICFGPPDPGLGRLCVDHDHQTNKARGLLCFRCNTGIGALGDDPETLRRAAAYLDTHHARREI